MVNDSAMVVDCILSFVAAAQRMMVVIELGRVHTFEP
jgi:hypothetical protein